jgi:LCP family protein required for cell wall assembly
VSSPFLLSARAFAGRLLISLLLVSTLTVAGVVAVNRGINDTLASLHHIDLVLPPAPPEGANYVILGSDSREFVKDSGDVSGFGDPSKVTGQRSDTLMVAHVEPAAKKTLIVSFPRDLIVDIPGHGKGKINSAFEIGGGGKDGAQLVIDTLQANFPGLKVNHYVQVDFRSFESIVDAIGTVGVYFPLHTRDFDSDPLGGATDFDEKAGCAKLTGVTALQYVRSRHLQVQDPNTLQWTSIGADAPDIHRIERQQAFIRELAGIAIDASLSDPLTGFDIANRVQSYLAIDSVLGRDELNQLIRAFRTVDVNDTSSLEFATIPWVVNPSTAFGSSLLLKQPDANDLVARLEAFGDTPPPARIVPSQVRVQVVDTTDDAFAAPVLSSLVAQGFKAGGTATWKLFLKSTEIHYGPNQVEAAKLLLDFFPDAGLHPDPADSDRVTIYLGTNFAGEITVPSTTTLPPNTAAPETTVAPAPTTTPPPTTTTLALGSAC